MTDTNLVTESVGERIRRLRKEKGLSQRDLSKLTLHMSDSYLSRIEMGDREPSLEVIREVAAALDINPVYVETGMLASCPHCKRSF